MHDCTLHPGWSGAAEVLRGASEVPRGAVDVWRVDLREVDAQPLRALSAGERARAARIANPGARALWMRGRGVLRVLIGGYLGCAPQGVELAAGRHGKLELAVAAQAQRLHFNLSHSGAMALYAFTADAPVGVDLELTRARARGERTRDEVALAERAFGAEVAERLRGLDARARGREFLRLWVRHEAALKCVGTGLAGAGRARAGGRGEADVTGGSREARDEAGASSRADMANLWIAELDVGPDAAGAVAVRGGPLEVCRREWPA